MTCARVIFALFFVAVAAGVSHAETVARNSIVHIACTGPNGEVTAGTGVIFSTKGHVLTARHVAEEGYACKARRGASDPAPVRSTTPVGDRSRYDYAILKLSPIEGEVFEIPTIARSSTDLTGEAIEIWGFPEGGPSQPSVSPGNISNAEFDENGFMQNLTQTRPGMSGGPVFAKGQLVGLVAGAEFDALGMVSNYALLAVETFGAEVREVRANVAADLLEEKIAQIELTLQQGGICNDLLRDALLVKHPELVPGITAPAAATNSLGERAEFWVTITTGPAQWLDCKPQKASLLNSHFFPMGLVLKPLRDVTIERPDGEIVDRTMFQTEYGLLVLIDKSATAPITSDVGYVFAFGNGVFKVCSPDDPPTCDPGQNLPPLNNNSAHWPFLSGWDSYLRTDDPVALEQTYAEYLDFRENRDLVSNNDRRTQHRLFQARLPKALDQDPACHVQKALLFEFNKVFDPEEDNQNSEYDGPVSFSFCTVPPQGAQSDIVTYRPIKVVTESLARKMFNSLWMAQVRYSPGKVVKDLLNILPTGGGPLIDWKKCGEVLDVDALGAPANGDAPIAIADLLEDERRISRMSDDPGLSYRFKLYQPSRGISGSATLAQVPLFQDIDLEIYCGDDTQPMRAQTVYIHFAPIFDHPLRLDMRTVEYTYVLKFRSYGFEGRSHIKDGYVERICDYPEYFNWLDTLKKEILKQSVLSIGQERLGVDKETVANHFAHLLMATLFFTEVEQQTQENPFGGCQ